MMLNAIRNKVLGGEKITVEEEKKRLSLLFAIISQRGIILLEEPTTFVD